LLRNVGIRHHHSAIAFTLGDFFSEFIGIGKVASAADRPLPKAGWKAIG